MSDRRLHVASYDASRLGENMHREIAVYFHDGGSQFFSRNQRKKGYYISSSIVKVQGAFKTWKMGQPTDGYVFLKEAARFNRKTLQALSDAAERHKDKINEAFDKDFRGHMSVADMIALILGYKPE
jgi:hypothetical protein